MVSMVPRRTQKGSCRYQVLQHVMNLFNKADLTLNFVCIAGLCEVGVVALGARNGQGRKSLRNRSTKSLRRSGLIVVETDRGYVVTHLFVLYEYKKLLEMQLHFVQDFALYQHIAQPSNELFFSCYERPLTNILLYM